MKQILDRFPAEDLFSQEDQIYYLFAFCKVGKPLVAFLRKLGLNCSNPQNNQEQGTVSTLIFFENVYLELFWIDEKSNLTQSEMMAEFNFMVRANWLTTGASPFGLSLSHPTENTNLSTFTIEAIKIAQKQQSEQLIRLLPSKSINFEEPICSIIPNYLATYERLKRFSAIPEQMRTQILDMRKLTQIKLKIKGDRNLSTSVHKLGNLSNLTIESSKFPLLEMIFDDHKQKKYLDLRPLLPIVMRY